MSVNRRGQGFNGSPNILLSVANQEVVPAPPSGWSMKYSFYKFGFANREDCHVSVNGGDWIFLASGMGFSTDINDAEITSFKIQEAGIHYNYVAGY